MGQLCENCEKNPAEKPHSCPYQEDMYGNMDNDYCKCCDDCRTECLMDI